ncbi:MAG: VanW family protein [Clostridium sp.]|nr:VanW family protein [Clostridium sp.]
MANDKYSGSYNAGPQLPSYMKKNTTAAKRTAAQGTATRSAASSARTSAAAKRTTAAHTTATRSTATRSTATRSTASRSSARGSAQHGAATHSTAAKANTRHAANQVQHKKRKRKKSGSGALKWIALAAAALICVIIIVSIANSGGADAVADMDKLMQTGKRFKAGVKLIGVDVSGMTPEEATGLVKNAAEKKLKTVAVTISSGENSWTLDSDAMGMGYDIAEALADGLNFGRGEDDNTVVITGAGEGEFDAKYTWDRGKIISALAAMSQSINTEATAAYAEPVTDWTQEERFIYHAGEEGITLNEEATADAIEKALGQGEFVCTVEATVNAVLPGGNIDDLKAATSFIASYTTKFSARRDDEVKQNRKFNIQKAADIINGNTVQPGEEWSFNTVVGPRTYELGWKGANGISGGKEYTIQAGGGICQVSTTLYNALLCANMEIVDRRAHTIPSDYVPVGLDATVDTRGIDFVWKNNTDMPAYIFARVEKVEGSSSRHTITVYVYGKPLPEGVTYQSRNEIIEERSRQDEAIYTNDASIPTGYQLERVQGHKYYVAEAYQDKYVDGKLAESKLLYTDKYKGNPPEVSIGTGAPLASGQTPDPAWKPYGTPLEDAN